jgi:Sigma-70 region 3
MAERFPGHLIETINKLVRTSRQMLLEIGREPTAEELAERLAMPLEKSAQALSNRRAADQPGDSDQRRRGFSARLISRLLGRGTAQPGCTRRQCSAMSRPVQTQTRSRVAM